jgi:hypothetical protein
MKGISQADLERIAAEKGLDITVSEPARIETASESPKPSKHRNILTEIDGLIFHSKKEARRYLDLREQQRAGAITELATQVNFPLCVNQILVTTYIADFTYRDREGHKIVEDVKSKHTQKMSEYQTKKNLMKAVLGIEIVEIL